MNQTTDVMDIKKYYVSEFQDFIKSLNGNNKQFLDKIRKEALENFSYLGFPTTRDEEWKYTNISPVQNQYFTLASKAGRVSFSKESLKKYSLVNNADLLVLINGVVDYELSDIKSKNIKIDSLSSFIKNEPEYIEKYFNRYVLNNDGLSALNTAFTSDGFVLNIPDGVIVDNPIQFLFLSGHKDNKLLIQPRNMIITGKNSSVKIIETYESLTEETYFLNSVTEIVVGENANVEYYKIQNENNASFHVSRTFTNQNRAGIFNSNTITLGGRIVRNDINCVLNGETSECHLFGIYLGDGKRLIDNHTLIDHAVPHCHSNELYKGILDESSRGVFNGKVIVRKDAQKTLAYQSNKNMLLSKSAKIDTKPQLEIFADDVKCSHGATVGQLDKDLLFYLQSRGISKDKARSILIKAFVNDVLEEIKIDQLKDSLSNMILERLHQVVL